MDDTPFCRNAAFRHANVQSKAVFSCTMTNMDKICGWEDEERAGGFEICRMHLDLHQRGVDTWAKTNSRCGGVLEATYVVHDAMHELGLCWNFR